MRLNRFSVDIWAHAAFDPTTLMVGSVASSVVGGVTSLIGGSNAQAGATIAAGGQIAAGNAALQAGQMQQAAYNYEAQEDTENASQAFAGGQRQMLADQDKTRLAISTAGTNAGVGSASVIQGQIAKRGSYNAAMDMFNGESAETGLLNKAAGETYSGEAALIGGEEAQTASQIQAQATIAGGSAAMDSSIGSAFGSFGNAFKSYGSFAFPTVKSS
jgi:hypothetical protein